MSKMNDNLSKSPLRAKAPKTEVIETMITPKFIEHIGWTIHGVIESATGSIGEDKLVEATMVQLMAEDDALHDNRDVLECTVRTVLEETRVDVTPETAQAAFAQSVAEAPERDYDEHAAAALEKLKLAKLADDEDLEATR